MKLAGVITVSLICTSGDFDGWGLMVASGWNWNAPGRYQSMTGAWNFGASVHTISRPILHPLGWEGTELLIIPSNMMPPYKSLCSSESVWDEWTHLHTEPYPLYLFIWLFINITYNILYNNPANISVSPSSVSHYRKLSNTQRELWGNSNLWPCMTVGIP